MPTATDTTRKSEKTIRKGCKQTDLGPLPVEWDAKRLGDIGEAIIGLTYRPTDVRGYGKLVLRASNIQNGTLLFEDNVFVDMEIPDKLMVQPGDILICVRNGSRPLIGKSALIDKNARGMTFGAFMTVFRSQNGPFIHHVFQSEIIKRQINEHLGATINQITNKSLKSFLAPMPSNEEEQVAIANVLNDADELIDSLEKLIAKKRDLKQAAMQELLKPKASWVEKQLGKTAILKARIGWQGLTTAEYRDAGDCRLVTGTDFKDGYIDWNTCHYVSELRYKQDKNIQLKEHDILVTKDGTIGKVALITRLEKPTTLNSGVFVIRPVENSFYPDFFYHLLCSRVFIEFLNQLSAGSTINHLYQKDFVHFVYKTPATINEQIAIAEVLTDMDIELSALEQRLKKTRDLKQGMMQELLTGRIRLAVTSTKEIAKAEEKKKSHNWEINEAVVISVLSNRFGDEKFPLGRKRYTKLSYLLHRHEENDAVGYLKKAAGPYNPETRYRGPEKIAQSNGYIKRHANGKYSGFISSDNVSKAENYFSKWYGNDSLQWLEQFRYKSNDQLEVMATVDMAMEDLRNTQNPVTLEGVKKVIQEHPEWEAKLSRPCFSDEEIHKAMNECETLFQGQGKSA